jgi:hypothetical protein
VASRSIQARSEVFAMTRDPIRVLAVLLIAFVGLYFNQAEFAIRAVALLLGS